MNLQHFVFEGVTRMKKNVNELGRDNRCFKRGMKNVRNDSFYVSLMAIFGLNVWL